METNVNVAVVNVGISDIPSKVMVNILEHLDVLDQHEAALVNRNWFKDIYFNPNNKRVLSILFGNCFLDDSEPPLDYFIDSEIPYKRLAFGPGIRLGTISKFCAKMGTTVEELIIKQSSGQKKCEKLSFSAGRLADILEHMTQLKSLDINWNMQTCFLRGNTVFQKQNGEKVLQALKNVEEFRLTACDVTAEQFESFVKPMKHLKLLYVEIQYTYNFYNFGTLRVVDWNTLVTTVGNHAKTLRHLCLDLRFKDNGEDVPVNKQELLRELQKFRDLKLETFSIHLPNEHNQFYMQQFFMRQSSTLKTLGQLPQNDKQVQPMQIHPGNLNTILKALPKLRNINIEVKSGYIRDMSLFTQITQLETLNIQLNRFERNHHLYHRSTSEVNFNNLTVLPKMKHFKIAGCNSDAPIHRFACMKCVLFMTLTYPNITRLELNVNNYDGLNDNDLQLIFRHLTKLEVLGVTNCKTITDDAFTGTLPSSVEPKTNKKKQNETFSISNLTRLHTLLLYPLEHFTDVGIIDGIAKLPNLKRLALSTLTNISAPGIEALADGCPKLQVIYFEDCMKFDNQFIKFMINRFIHLKYLRIGNSAEITDDLKKLQGISITPIGMTGNHNVVWEAYNAYKLRKGQMPLNVLDFEL